MTNNLERNNQKVFCRDQLALLIRQKIYFDDQVPPDAVEPLFKQIVNQFVHDRSRIEAITVGLNVVREICLCMPLVYSLNGLGTIVDISFCLLMLMTEDLLQDLVLYRKSHKKSVFSAARSLLTLFREGCPSLLLKKDRGRPIDPKARPKAYGEISVATNVAGVELLENDDGRSEGETDDGFISDDDDNDQNDEVIGLIEGDDHSEDVGVGTFESDFDGSGDDDQESEDDGSGSEDNSLQEDEDGSQDDDAHYSSDNDDAVSDENSSEEADENDKPSTSQDGTTNRIMDNASAEKIYDAGKRKFPDFDEQLNAANGSLQTLKKLAGSRMGQTMEAKNGILSNDDFQGIKKLKVG